MLVRITWALVVAALGTLIGGFFTPDSNVLLFVAIGLALSVIVLVLVSWARRAREATGYEERAAFTGGRGSDAGEELFASLEDDETYVPSSRRRSTSRQRPARRTGTARPTTAKAKPKAKPKAKAAKSTGGASKAKPTRKAKPKAPARKTTRPEARQPRPRPETPES